LLHYIENFEFIVALTLSDSSHATSQVSAAANILNSGRLQLQMMMSSVPNLLVKILYFIHIKFQAFLRSCAKASTYKDIKFNCLDWNEDLVNLIQGHGQILSMIGPTCMKVSGKERLKEKDNDYRNHGALLRNEERAVIHPYFNEFFKNRVGEKVIKLVQSNKEYPPKLDNKAVCLSCLSGLPYEGKV